MSIHQLSRVLANARSVTAGEFKLLCFLSDYADAGGGRVFPSDRRLLEHTGWTARYLRLVKGRLLRRRWIVLERAGGGRGRRTIYQLQIPLRLASPQLALPLVPVEILLNACGSAADEEKEHGSFDPQKRIF